MIGLQLSHSFAGYFWSWYQSKVQTLSLLGINLKSLKLKARPTHVFLEVLFVDAVGPLSYTL